MHGKQCRSRSPGFIWSQLIYTVFNNDIWGFGRTKVKSMLVIVWIMFLFQHEIHYEVAMLTIFQIPLWQWSMMYTVNTCTVKPVSSGHSNEDLWSILLYFWPALRYNMAQTFERKIVIFFIIHQFWYFFWVLKRTISSRCFFWAPTTYVLVKE